MEPLPDLIASTPVAANPQVQQAYVSLGRMVDAVNGSDTNETRLRNLEAFIHQLATEQAQTQFSLTSTKEALSTAQRDLIACRKTNHDLALSINKHAAHATRVDREFDAIRQHLNAVSHGISQFEKRVVDAHRQLSERTFYQISQQDIKIDNFQNSIVGPLFAAVQRVLVGDIDDPRQTTLESIQAVPEEIDLHESLGADQRGTLNAPASNAEITSCISITDPTIDSRSSDSDAPLASTLGFGTQPSSDAKACPQVAGALLSRGPGPVNTSVVVYERDATTACESADTSHRVPTFPSFAPSQIPVPPLQQSITLRRDDSISQARVPHSPAHTLPLPPSTPSPSPITTESPARPPSRTSRASSPYKGLPDTTSGPRKLVEQGQISSAEATPALKRKRTPSIEYLRTKFTRPSAKKASRASVDKAMRTATEVERNRGIRSLPASRVPPATPSPFPSDLAPTPCPATSGTANTCFSNVSVAPAAHSMLQTNGIHPPCPNETLELQSRGSAIVGIKAETSTRVSQQLNPSSATARPLLATIQLTQIAPGNISVANAPFSDKQNPLKKHSTGPSAASHSSQEISNRLPTPVTSKSNAATIGSETRFKEKQIHQRLTPIEKRLPLPMRPGISKPELRDHPEQQQPERSSALVVAPLPPSELTIATDKSTAQAKSGPSKSGMESQPLPVFATSSNKEPSTVHSPRAMAESVLAPVEHRAHSAEQPTRPRAQPSAQEMSASAFTSPASHADRCAPADREVPRSVPSERFSVKRVHTSDPERRASLPERMGLPSSSFAETESWIKWLVGIKCKPCTVDTKDPFYIWARLGPQFSAPLVITQDALVKKSLVSEELADHLVRNGHATELASDQDKWLEVDISWRYDAGRRFRSSDGSSSCFSASCCRFLIVPGQQMRDGIILAQEELLRLRLQVCSGTKTSRAYLAVDGRIDVGILLKGVPARERNVFCGRPFFRLCRIAEYAMSLKGRSGDAYFSKKHRDEHQEDPRSWRDTDATRGSSQQTSRPRLSARILNTDCTSTLAESSTLPRRPEPFVRERAVMTHEREHRDNSDDPPGRNMIRSPSDGESSQHHGCASTASLHQRMSGVTSDATSSPFDTGSPLTDLSGGVEDEEEVDELIDEQDERSALRLYEDLSPRERDDSLRRTHRLLQGHRRDPKYHGRSLPTNSGFAVLGAATRAD